MLCDDLEGWDGDGGGREVQEEGDMCTHVADSLCRRAEMNTTLKSNYAPFFFFLNNLLGQSSG